MIGTRYGGRENIHKDFCSFLKGDAVLGLVGANST